MSAPLRPQGPGRQVSSQRTVLRPATLGHLAASAAGVGQQKLTCEHAVGAAGSSEPRGWGPQRPGGQRKAGTTAVRGGPGLSPTVGLACRQDPGVEVAGIEPASFDAEPGLLRAQSAVPLLGPTDLTDESV